MHKTNSKKPLFDTRAFFQILYQQVKDAEHPPPDEPPDEQDTEPPENDAPPAEPLNPPENATEPAVSVEPEDDETYDAY